MFWHKGQLTMFSLDKSHVLALTHIVSHKGISLMDRDPGCYPLPVVQRP